MLNTYPHNGVCVCVCIGTRPRCPWSQHNTRICMCICVCCEQSLSSLFSFAGHTVTPFHNTGLPVSTNPYRAGVSRPVTSRSYRHSGGTDSTHRCCYEYCQRSQFTEDSTESSFLPVTVHSPPARSPVTTTPMWARLTTVASRLASRSLGYVYNCLASFVG